MKKTDAPSRLMAEMSELASDMHANGTMDRGTLEKITMRQVDQADLGVFAPISAAGVRAIRERSHRSQAVFAKHLNLTAGYVSQLERGRSAPQARPWPC